MSENFKRHGVSQERGRGKKLIDAADWLIEYGPICGKCRKQYQRRNPPEDPPCKTCYIEPLPENEEAIRIFPIVKNQFIMGMNGPISFLQPAIHSAMDIYDIKNKQQCFEKLLALEPWWIKKVTEK